jgi:hypothetical protein
MQSDRGSLERVHITFCLGHGVTDLEVVFGMKEVGYLLIKVKI